MRSLFSWRALTALNTLLIVAQIAGGYWIADHALRHWPADD